MGRLRMKIITQLGPNIPVACINISTSAPLPLPSALQPIYEPSWITENYLGAVNTISTDSDELQSFVCTSPASSHLCLIFYCSSESNSFCNFISKNSTKKQKINNKWLVVWATINSVDKTVFN